MIRKLHPARWSVAAYVAFAMLCAIVGLAGCTPTQPTIEDWQTCARINADQVAEDADPNTTTQEELKADMVKAIRLACGDLPS